MIALAVELVSDSERSNKFKFLFNRLTSLVKPFTINNSDILQFMGLKVYSSQAQASRWYENEFFKEFAENLTDLFLRNDYEGVLLGHPREKSEKRVRADAILFTPHQVIIFDFKNFKDGSITIPKDPDFETGIWLHNGIREVMGGRSKNPYDQLRKKKWSVEKTLRTEYSTRIPVSISVVFQGEPDFPKELPPRVSNHFFITNRQQYLEDIDNRLNVEPQYPPFSSYESILSHYETQVLSRIIPREFEKSEALSSAQQMIEDQQDHIDTLQQQLQTAEETKNSLEDTTKIQAAIEALKNELSHHKQQQESAEKTFDHQFEIELQKHNQKLEIQRERTKRSELKTQREKIKLQKAQLSQPSEAASPTADTPEVASADDEKQQKSRKRVSPWVWGIAALTIIILGILIYQIYSADKLHQQMLSGEVCIPVAEINRFKDSQDVCVTFTIKDVGGNENYIFLNDSAVRENRVFYGWIPSPDNLTVESAREQFLYKTVEIRGNIQEYEGLLQIRVRNMNQISVID